jgi:hypothetical protein
MKKSVFSIISNQNHANIITDKLLSNGFIKDDISILYSQKNQSSSDKIAQGKGSIQSHLEGQKLGHIKETKAPEGATTGALTGGVIGGTVGLLAGIGALAIPGLGPFIAAGPIMATLSGLAVGGGLGMASGALVGMGIPEYEAKGFQENLMKGKILMAVHANTNEEIETIKDLFKMEGGESIAVSKEIKVKENHSDNLGVSNPLSSEEKMNVAMGRSIGQSPIINERTFALHKESKIIENKDTSFY